MQVIEKVIYAKALLPYDLWCNRYRQQGFLEGTALRGTEAANLCCQLSVRVLEELSLSARYIRVQINTEQLSCAAKTVDDALLT